jgi:hypothetical protein
MLLEILRSNNICNEDELRMIQFLLFETTLRLMASRDPPFRRSSEHPRAMGSHLSFSSFTLPTSSTLPRLLFANAHSSLPATTPLPTPTIT